MYDHILVRYGELALKGKNRSQFIKTLARNLRRQLKAELGREVTVQSQQGRILIPLSERDDPTAYYPALDHTFGLSSYSPVIRLPLSEEAMIQGAIHAMAKIDPESGPFRVTAKRTYKRFPIGSMEMQSRVAEAVLAAYPELSPSLTDYVHELHIDMRDDGAYLSLEKHPGLGGLPLGTGGRALFLLSGGIDSPVAGWSVMRRGVVCEGLHFHSYPYTSKEAEEKVLTLATNIAAYAGHIKVHLVPFTRIQEEIGQKCHENLRITIMRRFMMRIGEEAAEARKAQALITGDSLGQVASQTIESIRAINAVTSFPILRPLIAMDKSEIIKTSKKIGTYETSILPYEDCCTVFVPKEPKTKPKPDVCAKEEKNMDIDALIGDALDHTETVICYADGQRERKAFEWVDKR